MAEHKLTAGARKPCGPVGRRVVGLLLVLVLSLGLTLALGLWDRPGCRTWQNDSEELIWGRLLSSRDYGMGSQGRFLCTLSGGLPFGHGVEYMENDTPTAKENGFTIYTHQVGLHGQLFSALDRVLDAVGFSGHTRQNLLWAINTALSLATILLLAIWVCGEWGVWGALGTVSCVFASPLLIQSMPNLFWVIWTMLLPTLVTAYWARAWEKGQSHTLAWSLLLAGTLMVRLFCGFEFTTTVMLSTEVPILYYFLKSGRTREDLKKWLRLAVLAGLVELAAFAAAFLLWMLQCVVLRGPEKAMQEMFDTVGKRTGAFTEQANIPELCEESLSASRLEVVRMYLTTPVVLWGRWTLAQLAGVAVVLKAVCWGLEKKLGGIRANWNELLLVAASLLPALSWHFMASAHSYIHPHINYILYLIPFVPLCMAMLVKDAAAIINCLEARRSHGLR